MCAIMLAMPCECKSSCTCRSFILTAFHHVVRSGVRLFARHRGHDSQHGERVLMSEPYNGMPADQLTTADWQKSRFSNPSGNCVEMAELPGAGSIAVRNSRDPDGPALVYTLDEIVAFIRGAKNGDFDNLIS
jgi:hypothetical protein